MDRLISNAVCGHIVLDYLGVRLLEYAEAMLPRRCSNRPHDSNYIMGSRCYYL